jgi:hypothetical protein
MKLTEEEWHTYPIRSGYQLMKSIRVEDEACWVEENDSRRREREWGKKKERRDEEERGRRPMYNTRVSASLAPLVHYKSQGG